MDGTCFDKSILFIVKIPKPTGAKWVKFNYKQVGYYRVNYAASVWDTLIENYLELAIADRTHLLEETFRLAESGHLNYSVPLKLVQSLKEETNYVPWSVASTMVEQIKGYLTASKYLDNFQVYTSILYVRNTRSYCYFRIMCETLYKRHTKI